MHFDGLRIRATEGIHLADAAGFTLSKIRLGVQKGPVFSIVNARSINVQGLVLDSLAEVLVSASGSRNSEVSIKQISGARYQTAVQAAPGVDASGILVQ